MRTSACSGAPDFQALMMDLAFPTDLFQHAP